MLLFDGVGGAHERLSRFRVNDQGAKGSGARSGKRAGGEIVDRAHVGLVGGYGLFYFHTGALETEVGNGNLAHSLGWAISGKSNGSHRMGNLRFSW